MRSILLIPSTLQDDNAKLAKEIEDRHAKELLDLEARDKASQLVAAEAANTGAEQLAEQMQAAVLDSKVRQMNVGPD